MKSTSAHASTIVIVKKKDDSNRIYADYRMLNRVTTFDPELMVTTQALFAKLAQDMYFSKLDLTKGYCQIPVKAEDIHKTAFVKKDAHDEYMRMPFKLVNSGATLVRVMRKVLEGIPT